MRRERTIYALSKELGSTKESIFAAIEFLERTEYIKRVNLCNCTGQCGIGSQKKLLDDIDFFYVIAYIKNYNGGWYGEPVNVYFLKID